MLEPDWDTVLAPPPLDWARYSWSCRFSCAITELDNKQPNFLPLTSAAVCKLPAALRKLPAALRWQLCSAPLWTEDGSHLYRFNTFSGYLP